MKLYHAAIFLNWSEQNDLIVESLMMILLSEYLASLVVNYSGGITMLS